MKKFISFIFILFSICFIPVQAEESSDSVSKIRQGTFARVMNREEFSTLTADIGDKVTFLNTQDMYVYETNAIPQNTIFYGQVEDVREPVEGKDGAIKVSIYKMVTPDRKVYDLKAHIYTEAENYLGGRNTESIYYHKIPYHKKRWRPILQVVPLNIYEMGKHTLVKPGAELFVIFEEDVILK